MSTIDFQNVIPEKFLIPQPISASKSILRKNLMEVVPNEGSQTYEPNGSRLMRFHLSSNTDFLAGPESYVRFELKRDGMDASLNYHTSLDEMGAHSLFRSIEIRMVSSGVSLQRYMYYNRFAVLQSNLYQSPQDVEQNGWNYGDSMGYLSPYSPQGRVLQAVLSGFGAIELSVSGLLTLNATDAQKVSPGDEIEIIATGTLIAAKVVDIITATTVQLEMPTRGAFTAIAQGAATQASVYRSSSLAARTSMVKKSGEVVIVELKPMLSLLSHQLPLFLMKGGIEIIFELEQPIRALRSNETRAISAGKVFNYKIENARFMAMFVTPHPDIVAEYLQQWKSGGLQYSIPAVVVRRQSGQVSDKDMTLTIHPGLRSARKAYTVVQHEGIHDSESDDGRISESLSTYLRTYINEFQYKVGSHNFPNREVRTRINTPNDDDFSEAFEQLKLVSGSSMFRFSYKDWQRVNLHRHTDDVKQSLDSKKFILSADFSRVQGGGADLSGVDLSVVPLDIDIKRDASWDVGRTRNGIAYEALPASSKPIYWTFIEHDAFLVISDKQVAVFQ
jgi:hypothetical protein